MYGITKARQLALFSLTNINKFNHDKSNAEIIFKNLTFDINNEHFTLIKYQQENEKNALIDIISGVDIQYAGYTYFLGNYINILDEKQRALLRNRMIGFVFKENHFFNHCNVFDNIYYSVINYKDKKKLKNNIINTLKSMGIEKLYNKTPKSLSTDQLLKVAFSRALVKKPKCIIANYNNDCFSQNNFDYFIQLLSQVHKDLSIPILLITNCNHPNTAVDKIITIKHGELYDGEKT
ncbi:ATP-binding cassette domain-containing protein [Proteus mirabilis]|uniref:ATP-binding cassette domain-containing protein n=1 Tax=Proteus mirabilis TaxID=584 RepID=UPI001B974807|nr:ATP-binding cassette domain-containing protein [Proteus mirabilis]MDC5896301.1 ATP-binding cassette domain-containing protein [Proteus mirabilis]MDC5917436.1 ATP-binding cassette domain-containing protein [Proteus mirabilis]MDC5927952.1 ATP-binding cassette domain-containing protein [Proteus mirabilis]MDC6012945.1 ATP-binding cassette domain-containing protein [Proteus mirabilis]MDC6023514.1 ATP-binding cassette domain-containing protein [Proteus mirabilis]